MGEQTNISWCDATFNPWRGCTKVSDGCRHCYAEQLSARNPAVLGSWGPRGSRAPAAESCWRQLRKWNQAAAQEGVRRRVFCASLADVFEGDETMPAESRPIVHAARGRLWREVEACLWLDFLLLTKRPENVAAMVPASWMAGAWPRNAWIGASAEDQPNLKQRAPHLLALPAPVRFLSCEPLLGPLDLSQVMRWGGGWRGVDWGIVGGESGSHARPLDIAWARSIVGQCRAAVVACFVKQLGARPVLAEATLAEWPGHVRFTGDGPGANRGRVILAHRSGADPAEWPADLRVQQWPEVGR